MPHRLITQAKLPTAVKTCLLAVSVLFLSSCTTQLAPSYHNTLYLGLVDANQKVMTHFASLSPSTQAVSCHTRKASFDNVIGQIDALTILAKTRPMPENAVIDALYQALTERGVPLPPADEAPSVGALIEISTVLKDLKRIDCEKGIGPNVLAFYQKGVEGALTRSLTYESFLVR